MTVILKPKTEIMVPKSVRRKAGLKPGDRVEFKVTGHTITIAPRRSSTAADEYTLAERRAINRGITASEKDYQEGRSYGPFDTHAEFISSLRAEAAKLDRKKKIAPRAMTLDYSKHFLRSYHKAPGLIQKAFEKQSQFLLQDLHHPSLRAKKYDEARSIWQARVTRDWRFYFEIDGEVYRLTEIRSHPK